MSSIPLLFSPRQAEGEGWRLAIFLTAFLLVLPLGRALAQEPTGEVIFKSRCTECHALPDPTLHTEAEWQETLKRMAENAKLNKEERQRVLEYLVRHLQEQATDVALRDQAQLFEAKCSRCHTLTRIFLEPLTPEARAHIVSRMREKDPGWISEAEAQQIADFLQRLRPDTVHLTLPQPRSAQASAVFEARCSACHTLERVFLKAGNVQDWAHIVHRMHEKAPTWISDQDAEKILQYLNQVLGDGNGAVAPAPAPPAVERQAAGPTKVQTNPIALGRRLFEEKKCNACHAIKGEGGTVGPDLGTIGARRDPASIRRQILNPQPSPGPVQMLKIPLTPAELDALVAYLSSLK